MSVTIREATPADASLIYGFIRALAKYEKLLDQVEASEADLAGHLFCETPRLFCDIAEGDGKPVVFAFCFYNYSTFKGRHGIYLEDLFVVPEAHGLGAGKALLRALAKRCVAQGLARLEWSVLDWNAPSIAFYDSLGAEALNEWITRRMTGEPLKALAAG